MNFPFGETVRVLRAAQVVDPFAPGETRPDWGSPTVVEFGPCPVWPTVHPDTPVTDRPWHVAGETTVVLPYGADVTSSDRVEVVTGPLVGVYDIDGAPAPWKNPFTGWGAGVEVRLMKVTG